MFTDKTEGWLEFVKRVQSVSTAILTTLSNSNLKELPLEDEEDIKWLHAIHKASIHVI